MVSRNISLHTSWAALAIPLLLGACADRQTPSARDAGMGHSILVEPVAPLRVESGAILASANSLASDRYGRIYIGDNSDRRIKVFGADGSQEQPVGAPGAGPGEFTTLFAAGLLSDSVYGWDGSANRLTVFGPDGEPVREIPLWRPGSPVLSRVRTMDDSLLVASGWVAGVQDKPLVEVFDREGRRHGRMMNFERMLSSLAPDFSQHTSVYADGSDGVVFSTMHGVDTLVAYNSTGRLLGAGRIGLAGFDPVLDLRDLLKRGGGRLRSRDGTWAQDGHYAALKLVALGGDVVAVQFARLDVTRGTDLLSSGGPVVVLRLNTTGTFERLGQVVAPGAMLGRSGPGEAYILQWSGSDLSNLNLFRLTVATESPIS